MSTGMSNIGDMRMAINGYRLALLTVFGLSALLNILMLGGSLYMMMVYDAVLPSHSIQTLFGLFAMVTVAYIIQGTLDALRNRILSDIGSAIERKMALRVQDAIGELALRGMRGIGDGLIPMRDLDNIRAFATGPWPTMLMDLPWILFFLAILAILHWTLAVTTIAGACVLFSLTWATDRLTKKPISQLAQVNAYRNATAESNARHIELLAALGMRQRMISRWEHINNYYQQFSEKASRDSVFLSGLSKVFRQFLQSGILTVGAMLVLDGKASGGVIFASSMISGRVLAPLDSAIANWKALSAARIGWKRLSELLIKVPMRKEASIQLPAPKESLEVTGLFVGPPGTTRLTVQGVDLVLRAGDGLGIIGPSAAGKSSLARALIGVWKPLRGKVCLDGAALDQWDEPRLGAFIGYLPQSVELLEGTVAENIARFEPDAPSQDVIAAAMAAGVHNLIVALPDGYDTRVGPDGEELSAGQRQRIGLARALFHDPFIVLLDEPNSNLDAEGDAALDAALRHVRERKGIVIVIAHRPSVLANVSHVLFLHDGRVGAFGPRDEVMAKISGGQSKPKPNLAASNDIPKEVRIGS